VCNLGFKECDNMYGPNDFNHTDRHHGAEFSTSEGFQMTRQDIDRCIARAHRLRAEHLAAWGQRVARTWGSLFRRPGRLLPPHTGSRDRMVNAAQL
jgi:hypothetical protein